MSAGVIPIAADRPPTEPAKLPFDVDRLPFGLGKLWTRLDRNLMRWRYAIIFLMVFGMALLSLSTFAHSEYGWPYPPAWLVCILYCGGIAGYFIARARMIAASYDVHPIDPPAELPIGGSFRVGADVYGKRRSLVGPARVVLSCREKAIKSGGESSTTYEHELLQDESQIGEARPLYAGSVADFHTQLSLPAMAVPSAHCGRHSVEWLVTVSIPVKGMCPDIHNEHPLIVAPSFASDANLQPEALARAYVGDESLARQPRDDMAGVTAEAIWEDAQSLHGLPVLQVGGSYSLRVQMRATQPVQCRSVHLWVGCKARGSGDATELDLVADQVIHEGPFGPAQGLTHRLTVGIPQQGPISYKGTRVKFDWSLELRVDVPIWRDKSLSRPFLVLPAQAYRAD